MKCEVCGVELTRTELALSSVCALCQSLDDEAYSDPDFDPPQGFYYTDTEGHMAHILGDPNMSQELLDALDAMIKAVYKRLGERES
jgi:hypothetical protein